MDAILGFDAAGAVLFDDVDDEVEEGRADTTASRVEFLGDVASIGRVTRLEQALEPLRHLGVAEANPRQGGVFPAQREPTVGCAETSAQEVVERVEIAAPPVVGQELRELVGEPREVGEPRAVDHQDWTLVIGRHAEEIARSAHPVSTAPIRDLGGRVDQTTQPWWQGVIVIRWRRRRRGRCC